VCVFAQPRIPSFSDERFRQVAQELHEYWAKSLVHIRLHTRSSMRESAELATNLASTLMCERVNVAKRDA